MNIHPEYVDELVAWLIKWSHTARVVTLWPVWTDPLHATALRYNTELVEETP